jgi:hypothetical protein
LLGNSYVKTATPQQEKEALFYGFSAEQTHGDTGSLLPGTATVNMHHNNGRRCFPWGPYKGVILETNGHIVLSSEFRDLSSEFSIDDSHGSVVVEEE